MTKAISLESRIIASLANHERLLQQVGQMKKQIGENLLKCPVMIRVNSEDIGSAEWDSLYDQKGLVKTHLWAAFNTTIESDYGGQIQMDRDDQENYLTDPWNDETPCEHCYAAWRVIQERKEVRQELGRARRSLRMLGKSALKVAP